MKFYLDNMTCGGCARTYIWVSMLELSIFSGECK